MVLEFIIYGGDDEIIKQLETKVKTGFLGSLRVDKDYIKYGKIDNLLSDNFDITNVPNEFLD